MSSSDRLSASKLVGGEHTTRASRRLAALALIAAISSVVGLSAWGSWTGYQSDRRVAIDMAVERATAAAQDVDRYVADQLAYLDAVAKGPPVGTAVAEQIGTYLQTVLPGESSGLLPALDWIDATGRSGVRASGERVNVLTMEKGASGYFQRVARARRPVVSGVLPAANGTGVPIIVLAVPTFGDRGAFVGAITAAIALDRLSVISQPSAPARPAVTAVDRTARLVFDERPLASLQQLDPVALAKLRAQRGRAQVGATDLRGRQDRLIATADAPIAGWTMISNQSMDDALGGPRRRLRDEWIAVAGVGLLGGCLALTLLQRVEGLRRGQIRQSRTWQQTSDALLIAPDSSSVDGICVARARELLSADSAVIAESTSEDGGIFTLIGEQATEWERTIAAADGAVRAAIEGGRPAVLQNRSRLARRRVVPGLSGFETVVVCQLEGRSGGSRTLLLGFRNRRAIGPSDLQVLEALSGQCSLTRRRLDALTSEAASRERLERLNRVSAALAAELDEAGIVHVLLREGAAAVRASRGSVYRREPSGDLSLIDGFGFTKEFLNRWRSVPGDAESPLAEAVRTNRLVLVETPAEFNRRYPSLTDERLASSHELAAVPLRASGRTLGVLGLSFSEAATLSGDDTELLASIADLGAQALDRATAYETEHRIAARLQRALLTTRVPNLPGFEIATCYRPAVSGMEIGGDWWDVFVLDERRLAVIAGDVVGRGLEASAAMGQLRSAARALAKDAGGPSALLERLDGFVEMLEVARFTTIACAEVDIETGTLTYACAGHPPPLIVGIGGHSRFLEEGRSTPLGLTKGPPRRDGHARLRVDEVLILYTDGLIERRGESLDEGLSRLTQEASRIVHGPLPSRPWPDEIADALVEDRAGLPDDVCVITVRRTPERVERLHRRLRCDPAVLAPLRHDVANWLDHLGVPPDRIGDVILACGEACSNAIEHAYYGRSSPGFVDIDARYADADDLLVEVRDFGSWRVPYAPGNRGRGRKIMEQLAAEFELDSRANGTTVKLRFRDLGP